MIEKFGATGKYPDGSFGPHDEGELQIGIAVDSNGYVHINFGKDVSWLALPKHKAIELANIILAKASE